MRVMPTRRSAHRETRPFDAQSSPRWSPSCPTYGIRPASCACQSRSSHASRVLASAGAPATIGTSPARALLAAVPMAPDEPSTCSSAGKIRSMNTTAPSAASTGWARPTVSISEAACFTRWIAGCDFQSNAWRRKRASSSHSCASAFAIVRRFSRGRGRRAVTLLVLTRAGLDVGGDLRRADVAARCGCRALVLRSQLLGDLLHVDRRLRRTVAFLVVLARTNYAPLSGGSTPSPAAGSDRFSFDRNRATGLR